MKSTLPEPSSLVSLYVFRVLHIGSLIGLSFKVIKDWQAKTVSTDNALLYSIIGVVAMASGFINTFLLKPKKMGENRKLWISWSHIKLLVSLLVFLPTYKFIPVLNGEIINVRFYWLLTMILISPAARFYREYFTKKQELTQTQQYQSVNESSSPKEP